MKKTYKAPLTEVVKINAEQMICESIENVNREINASSSVDAGSALDKEDWFYNNDLW